jgi:hypothetical protein
MITLSLRTPSGVIITQADAGTNPDVQFISGPNSRAFQINAPEAGNWTMIITAGTIATGILEIYAFADHDGLQLNVSVTDDTVTAPESVEIQATPTFGGENVVCATMPLTIFDNELASQTFKKRKAVCPTVTGTVTRPTGPAVPITLFDDGLAAHADAVAGDGIYSARFSNYQGSGTYTFDLTVTTPNGITYSGESLFSFNPSNTNPVPLFTRMASTTAVVTAVAAVPRIVEVNPAQGTPGQTLNITVTGENTNFVNGTSVASFSGGGITVNSTTVTSPTSATVNITIAPNAVPTARDVTITTGSEVVTAPGAFLVLNSPPICVNARPSVPLISPPNRNFVQVGILDVTDPNNDPVSIAITTVRQDEPVDHIGDGSFAPDAIISGSTAQVRAESILGTVVAGGNTFVGNGRFYHIGFTASDTFNNSCTGTVKVAVPHTRLATPIDGGPLFNSTSAQLAGFSNFGGDTKAGSDGFRGEYWYSLISSSRRFKVRRFGEPADRPVFSIFVP